MTTVKPTTARKAAVKLSITDQVALAVVPAIYASAGYELLNQKDGRIARRAVHLAYEVADAFEATRARRAAS